MRLVAWSAAVVVALALTGCSSSARSAGGASSGTPSTSTAGTMPDVTGLQLDKAEAAIEAAGGDPDQIKILGGGALGVVVKSNWQVCSQSPAVGQSLTDTPELTIEHNCADTSSSAASSGATPTASPSEQPITTADSAEFAAVLQVGDECDPSVAAFAAQNGGRDVEFDGSIRSLANHGNTKTRYDILIAPGDAGPNATTGPNLQYQDVNLSTDLNFQGTAPESLNAGTKLHIVATVGDYSSGSCLLQLKPVSTEVR